MHIEFFNPSSPISSANFVDGENNLYIDYFTLSSFYTKLISDPYGDLSKIISATPRGKFINDYFCHVHDTLTSLCYYHYTHSLLYVTFCDHIENIISFSPVISYSDISSINYRKFLTSILFRILSRC